MSVRASRTSVAAAIAVLATASTAHAIPAFARKYATSCQTCHTVYPKLNGFGEAFRRNGYRFPGSDSRYVAQEPVALGQPSQRADFPRSTWPSWIPSSTPLAVGFDGNARLHPDPASGGGRADDKAVFTTSDLVARAHLWAGGSLTERTTFFGELVLGSDGRVALESGRLLFADLGGLHHAFTLAIGRGPPTLTSFGAHSSYVADTAVAPLFVTALFLGSPSSTFDVTGAYPGIELNGIIAGRIDYSLGIDAGANLDTRPTENVYGHVGFKLGGLRLDGEGGTGLPDARPPWEETALTVDAFVYRSASHYLSGVGNAGGSTFVDEDVLTFPVPVDDTSWTFGAALRAQLGSLALDAGAYRQAHDRASTDGMNGYLRVDATTQWDELSYVVFPWLVPALRLEYTHLDPAGAPSLDDLRVTPGVAALVLADVKLVLAGRIEWAKGAPPGGWSAVRGLATPGLPTATVLEIESIDLSLAYAF